MAVPVQRVHEAHEGKPPARRAATETGPIRYTASIGAGEAGTVRRVAAAMSRHFAADIKDSGGGPFQAQEVMQEALSLGLHFLGIQYLGDPRAFEADGRHGEVHALGADAPAGKSKP